MQEIYKYGPYGEPWVASASTPDVLTESFSGARFRYTGQTTIPEARLYNYKARIYDPAYGRFMQTDPIGSKDDLNLYGYVKGDPVNNTDPTGNQTFPQAFYPEPATMPTPEQYRQTADFIEKHPGETIEIVGTGIQAVGVVTAQPEIVAGGRVVSGVGTGVKWLSGEKPSTAVPVTHVGNVPKAPKGPGLVPPSDRDPKRLWTPKEREAKRTEQGNECATGCGTKIDQSNSNGHHRERHADGGRTDNKNHDEVCHTCHTKIHE